MNILIILSRELRAILVVPKKILVRGMLLGLLVAFLAIQSFVCVELWRLNLTPSAAVSWDFYIQFLLFTLILANGISFLPVISSSYLLTLVLYHQAKRQKLTATQSVLKGALVGAATGITICIVGWFTFDYRGGNFPLFLIRTFFVTLIAAVSAGWAAKDLASYISRSNVNHNDGTIVGV